jgi:arylsulfatase A
MDFNNLFSKLTIPTTAISLLALAGGCETNTEHQETPNIILIFTDDMGYGDIGVFGSELHRTPHLDRMASEGIMLTEFYSASSVCTPSRAALLTGSYPIRVDMVISGNEKGRQQVLFPVANKGLNPEEITIQRILKEKGYATACIGKWHLGDHPDFMPFNHNFDCFFGIPYSNDMGAEQLPRNPPLPLLVNDRVIEAPVDQTTLTKRYTEEAIRFMKENKDKPFFVYMPHTMPHVPIFASDSFVGRSANGIYGDAIEELDWSTGQILDYLRQNGLDKNTLVIFTSDNGAAWQRGGSNLPFSGWKGSNTEGGFRVPMIAWWPGKIPSGKINDGLSSTMDFLPTIAQLCNIQLPVGHIIDGKDITSLLFNPDEAVSPNTEFYYYLRDQLQAIRWKDWKLYLPLESRIMHPWSDEKAATPGRLFNLAIDPKEEMDVIALNPDVVAHIMAIAQRVREDMGDHELPGRNVRPAGMVEKGIPWVLK